MILAQDGDKYSIAWDDEKGSVSLELGTVRSLDDLADFYPALVKALDRSRARHGGALVLVNLADMPVMPATMTQDAKDSFHHVGPNDRVATIVNSMLLTMQLKRNMADVSAERGYFGTREDAETWLYQRL